MNLPYSRITGTPKPSKRSWLSMGSICAIHVCHVILGGRVIHLWHNIGRHRKPQHALARKPLLHWRSAPWTARSQSSGNRPPSCGPQARSTAGPHLDSHLPPRTVHQTLPRSPDTSVLIRFHAATCPFLPVNALHAGRAAATKPLRPRYREREYVARK